MNTKNLSSRQVCWAQKSSQYDFRINYYQDKANTIADTLFCFFQKSQIEEIMLKNKNTQIFHCLHTLLTQASIARLSLSSFSGLE